MHAFLEKVKELGGVKQTTPRDRSFKRALNGTSCVLATRSKIWIRSSVIEFTWLEFHPLESAGVSSTVSIINKKIWDMGMWEALLPSILNQLIACRRKPWLCELRGRPARAETGFRAEVVIISDGESVCSYSVCPCVFWVCFDPVSPSHSCGG